MLFKVNPRNWHCTWCGAQVLHCREERRTPSSHWWLWCRVRYKPWWWPMSWWSNQQQVQDRFPWLLLVTSKDPSCRVHPAVATLSPAEAALINFQNYAKLPPHKKKCKEEIKMKFDIALQQNCDQSATVWWSTHSYARGLENGALLWTRAWTIQ